MKTFFFVLSTLLFNKIMVSQSEPYMIEGLAQGTTYHIKYFDEKARDFSNEIAKILQEFDLSVSTYNPESIISRINRNEKKVVLDKTFIICFNKAKEVCKNTEGAFDPTVYPLVNAWGFGPGKKQTIEKGLIDSILTFVGFDKIWIKKNKIKKKDSRVALDFNAFAQGYSVDVVSDFLNKQKIYSYVVEIGGEVFAKGKTADGFVWTVGIEEPIDNKETENPLLAIANLESTAVATSGDYRRYQMIDGVKYAHHIDPKTGYPTKNNLLSASVFAPDCISADANATGILVMGLEKAKVFLAQHPELQAYLIYSDEHGQYQVFQTEGMKNIIIN